MSARHNRIRWATGALACMALLAAFALHALFDPDRAKALAQDRVKAIWGRDLAIGKLSLQLSPFPALHASKVSLSNPSWAKHRNLLEAEQVTARLELLPLLSGQVVVSAIAIDGLTLHLEAAEDGANNWCLQRNSGAGGMQPRGEPVFDPKLLTSLEVRDARIDYANGSSVARTWQVERFAVRARRGWRDASLDARIAHAGQTMRVAAQIDDLSSAGEKGAVSEGRLEAQWDRARLRLSGLFPLEAALRNLNANAVFDAESLDAPLGFFGIRNKSIAPLKLAGDLHASPDGGLQADHLTIRFGTFEAQGKAVLKPFGRKPSFDAQLSSERLDWAQFMHDIGRPAPRPKAPDELFRTDPLPWKMLADAQPIEGRLQARIGTLRLRSGTELRDAQARMALGNARLDMAPFSFKLFGGTAAGRLQLDGRKRHATLALNASGISTGAWLHAKGKREALTGGPMSIDMQVDATGSSMKELASSVTGPVMIRVGEANVLSKKIRQAETLLIGLTPLFSEKDAEHVELACASARLPFVYGRAAAEPIAGIRSSASQLLLSGYVDLRRQSLDVRGRIRARSGISLGASALAGTVRISGKLSHPETGLDPSGAPETVARLGAAVLTGGASLLATALWDAATPGSDACQAVFDTKKPATAEKRQNASASRTAQSR